MILALLTIPMCFAQDNQTQIGNSADLIQTSQETEILTANADYYFDASAENDNGDGSINNPYKYLTFNRITPNSNIHLANGQYNLNYLAEIYNVNIIGDDSTQTIIKYDGVGFNVRSSLTLQNLTLGDLSIYSNGGKIKATNTIFNNCHGNDFGGAINSYNSEIIIDNCTFSNNHGEYGGAIYLNGGKLDITEAVFLNNYAYRYGGAIACENSAVVNISKSKFFNSKTINGAGGAIYLKYSTGNVEYCEFSNSNATFGGTITSLSTNILLNNVVINNSNAKYDGGGIYHMYGIFSSTHTTYNNNSAQNGGALFIDKPDNILIENNAFSNNKASQFAGAFYLLSKDSYSSFQNTYLNNKAAYSDNEYITDSYDLFIGNGNYTLYKTGSVEISSLPSRYSLVDDGYVTVAKDQKDSGNCWAFTGMAVLESCILKAGGEALDLSEGNLKNIIAKFSDYGWSKETNTGGGNFNMVFGYLTSWLGSVYEIDDIYDDYSVLSPVLDSIAHIQNIVLLSRSNYVDNNQIKEALLKYGAVGTSMYSDEYYSSYDGINYYCDYAFTPDHAVTIVGWDDNYSKDNFIGSPAGDGAWIVKNSWGPNWANNGFFYVSYYDKTLAMGENKAYTFILNDTRRYDKNYQYDISGESLGGLAFKDSVWYKNIFTATDNEYLAGVSTFFNQKTNWTVSIFINNELKLVRNGFSNPGYYTVDFGELLSLNKGDVFEVVYNISASDIKLKLCMDKWNPTGDYSYYSRNGINWYSPGDELYRTFSIKAFTVLDKIDTITNLNIVFNEFDANITAQAIDQYGNILNSGNMTFKINNAIYVVRINNGVANFIYEYGDSINYVSATYNSVGYSPSTNSSVFNSNENNISLDIDVEVFSDTAVIKLNASKPVNETVIIYVNDEKYSVELTDGTYSLILENLDNGNYIITGNFKSVEINCENATKEFVIDATFNSTIEINGPQFIKYDEDALIEFVIYPTMANGNVTLWLNGKEYNNTKFNQSAGSFLISKNDLTPGNNTIAVQYLGNNKFSMSNIAEMTISVKISPALDYLIDDAIYVGSDVVIMGYLPDDACGEACANINGVDYVTNVSKGLFSFVIPDLGVGNYSGTLSYCGDWKYYNVSKLLKFNIYKLNPNMTVNIENITKNSANIHIMLPEDATGNITLLVDNERKIIRNVSGSKTIIEIADLTEGLHEFDLTYSGDEKYTNAFCQDHITVRKAIINVNTTDITINILGNNTGNITVKIDNKTVYTNTSISNTIIIPLKNITPGNHTVTVIIDGVHIIETCVFNVPRVDSDMLTDVAPQAHYGETVIIKIALPEDAKGNITVLVDNDRKIIRNVSGSKTIIEIADLTEGLHEFDLTYSGDEKYKPSSTKRTTNLVVVAVGTEIVVEKDFKRTATDYNAGERGEYFYAYLKDQDGKPLAKKTVQIAINGPIYTVVTDSEGKAGLQINMASANTYTYALFFQGDEKYNASLLASSKLIVTKKPMYISASNQVFKTTAKTKTVTVTLSTSKNKDGKMYLNSGKQVTLTVNGKTYTAKSDANGIVKFNIGGLTKKGTYSAVIKFAGDRTYETASKTIKITLNDKGAATTTKAEKTTSAVLSSSNNNANVKTGAIPTSNVVPTKKNTYIEVDANFTRAATDYNAGERGAFFYATLKDSDGNPLANKTVQIAVNGPIYNVTTNEKGQAGLQVNLASANTYTYALSFSGDSEYNAAALACSKLVVTKKPITISAKDQTFKATAKTKTVTATLLTSKNPYDGKTYLSPKKVTLKVDGKTYTGTINSAGKVNFNIQLTKKGTYSATISFDGDKTYDTASKTIKIKIN